MSNLIKSTYYITSEEIKLIEVADTIPCVHTEDELKGTEDEQSLQVSEEDRHLLTLKDDIIREAELFAKAQIQQSMDEIVRLKEQAAAEIEQWWNERRQQDEELIAASQKKGFNKGYEEGLEQAELVVREENSKMLEETRTILKQSHLKKEHIIREAEPFLIELSCGIAEKIIGKQLTVSPEWILSMVKKVLSRRREEGIITLCVSLSQFSYIQDARDELSLSIDSQAELAILPDSTVDDFGCVIRSAFGSMDARIDTQLSEIKNALHQLALRSEETHGNE
ncbi:MAG TPA: FliH/SctL family protein [Bacilli bacterium]